MCLDQHSESTLRFIMTSVLPPYVQAASGSLGAVIANARTYPLDLITTHIQAADNLRLTHTQADPHPRTIVVIRRHRGEH